MRRIALALALLAALAGCVSRPALPYPSAAAIAAASTCQSWSPGRIAAWARLSLDLPPEYVAAACARGWTRGEIILRASSRGYLAGASCAAAASRRPLYAPCGDGEHDRGQSP